MSSQTAPRSPSPLPTSTVPPSVTWARRSLLAVPASLPVLPASTPQPAVTRRNAPMAAILLILASHPSAPIRGSSLLVAIFRYRARGPTTPQIPAHNTTSASSNTAPARFPQTPSPSRRSPPFPSLPPQSLPVLKSPSPEPTGFLRSL